MENVKEMLEARNRVGMDEYVRSKITKAILVRRFMQIEAAAMLNWDDHKGNAPYQYGAKHGFKVSILVVMEYLSSLSVDEMRTDNLLHFLLGWRADANRLVHGINMKDLSDAELFDAMKEKVGLPNKVLSAIIGTTIATTAGGGLTRVARPLCEYLYAIDDLETDRFFAYRMTYLSLNGDLVAGRVSRLKKLTR